MMPLRIWLVPSERRIRRVLAKDERRKLRARAKNEVRGRKRRRWS
jgi:hypothetical protein